MMAKLEVRFQVLNILINTQQGHPALLKFVQTGGTDFLNDLCIQIRDNKKFTADKGGPDPENQRLYRDDLLLFQKLVRALRILPITSKVLTETKIGKGVNSIVKDGIFKTDPINEDGLKLVNDWKDLVRMSSLQK